MPRPRRSLGLFTAILVAWTAVWCCCRPAAAATPTHPARSCCAAADDSDPKTGDPKSCPLGPMSSDDCPIAHVRETSLAPTLPVLPAVNIAAIVPSFQVFSVLIPTAARAPAPVRIAPATGPPTLLALHTSLLW